LGLTSEGRPASAASIVCSFISFDPATRQIRATPLP
jgi:hypothetical protein